MANQARPVVLGKAPRAAFDRVPRSVSGPAGLSWRAGVMHLRADDISRAGVVRMTGHTFVHVSRLRRRCSEEGLAGLLDKPQSGQPPALTARTRAQVVASSGAVLGACRGRLGAGFLRCLHALSRRYRQLKLQVLSNTRPRTRPRGEGVAWGACPSARPRYTDPTPSCLAPRARREHQKHQPEGRLTVTSRTEH